jgi:cytochrome c oxidase subunit III
MASASSSSHSHYFVPSPSAWPALLGLALLALMLGAVALMNDVGWLKPAFYVGLAGVLYVFFGWFGQVIGESESQKYNKQVDVGFRWSMSWFIFSEVMFFAAFFGALGYARILSVPDLGSLDAKLLWPDFADKWPTAGPYIKEGFSSMGAWGIPAINTALLLTSGVTLTICHHALVDNKRQKAIFWLAATIILGVIFLGLQAYEYSHAYSDLNLKLTSGIFGSTFYLLTGFHGFHVTMGAIMLTVMLFRLMKGHFTEKQHFAFEAAAWYWHFVDVVWLLLFVLVYML